MTTQIRCATRFDITVTGVRNHTNRTHLPFQDQAGQAVTTDHDWNRSRNQQRNWETVNQILALRTLPEHIVLPVVMLENNIKIWQFEFEVPSVSSLSLDDDVLGSLKQDCAQVPMITGLGETAPLEAVLRVCDPGATIWFEVLN